MKNIKENYKSYEDAPSKIGMKKKLYKQNNKLEVMYPDHNCKGSQFWSYMENYIKSNIGKSFDSVYSKFIQKCKEKHFPSVIWGSSIGETFINAFKRDRYWISRYYIDESGLIQKNEPTYKHVKQRVVFEEPKVIGYVYDRDNSQEVYALLYKYFGREKTYHWTSDNISVDEFNNSIVNLFNNNINFRGDFHDNVTRNVWSGLEIAKYVFYQIKDAGVYLDPGTPKYNQYKAELSSSRKKYYREKELTEELKRETLLHDIEHGRIEKERELDRITRDRFGFDEESFKGEWYHGQKRKLKKQK